MEVEQEEEEEEEMEEIEEQEKKKGDVEENKSKNGDEDEDEDKHRNSPPLASLEDAFEITDADGMQEDASSYNANAVLEYVFISIL